MKRIFAVLTVVFALFSVLCGCAGNRGGTDAPSSSENTAEKEPPAAAWKAHFLNVGKADAILLEADGLFYLIDTGTKESFPVLQKAFETFSVTELQSVFITHTDKDHIGGLSDLLGESGVAVGSVCAPAVGVFDGDGKDKVDKKAEKYGFSVTRLPVGEQVPVGKNGLYLEVLAPVRAAEGENNNSLVMKLRGGASTALFTGDAQFFEEYDLLERDISADVLKVAHHGSDEASSYSFLKAVGAKIAVISTSTAEREETPSPIVLSALDGLGAKVYVTQDAALCVTVTSDGHGALNAVLR